MRILVILIIALAAVQASAEEVNLIANGDFEQHDSAGKPAGYTLTGAANYRYLGDERRDMSSMGVALDSSKPAAAVTCTVDHLDAKAGRWYRFSFRALPQANFAVTGNDDLAMKVEFYGASAGQAGAVSYDGKAKPIYEQITDARRDLTVNGVRHQHGAEVWQTYTLVFMLPFPQVDRVKLAVGFDHGSGRGNESAFEIDDMSLVRISDPPLPANAAAPTTQPASMTITGKLLPLGGRWFYHARDGETAAPTTFNTANADRLLYKDNVYSAPFAGNTSAVLRKGDKDLAGKVVEADRLLPDNVTITFNESQLIFHTHGVPNHPTGRFPEQGFGNPSYITEQQETFYLPLNPKENDKHFVTTANNSNHALPMGPIGIAINGVVFFNPFDMGNTDATDMMDRCCGHPNQIGQYHYHKYPICVNSPWADEGNTHSPLLGFAFDGYPLYGPYESKDVMAKDVKGERALNDFNAHYDAERGWHYHVTPGKFPYLIGGYWGTEDAKNMQRPPRGGGMDGGRNGPPGGGPGGGGPGGGPGGFGPSGGGRGGPPDGPPGR